MIYYYCECTIVRDLLLCVVVLDSVLFTLILALHRWQRVRAAGRMSTQPVTFIFCMSYLECNCRGAGDPQQVFQEHPQATMEKRN